MASLGHLAVGAFAGRALEVRSARKAAVPMLLFAGLSMLPDVDYLGVALGVPNHGPCGHRGASHSLVPALVISLIVAALAPRWNLPRWRTAAVAGLVVGSHLLLDAMTTSSRGVPLFWPITFQRFEMPWRPIPNAPCGLSYVSWQGFRVACTEYLQFLPLLLFAFRPAPDESGRAMNPIYRHYGKATRTLARVLRRAS